MTLVRRLGLYFSCLFFSHTSFGLGLGELSIDSSLNQQLQAEIEKRREEFQKKLKEEQDKAKSE